MTNAIGEVAAQTAALTAVVAAIAIAARYLDRLRRHKIEQAVQSPERSNVRLLPSAYDWKNE